jgi:hypothetical protein
MLSAQLLVSTVCRYWVEDSMRRSEKEGMAEGKDGERGSGEEEKSCAEDKVTVSRWCGVLPHYPYLISSFHT